MHDHTTAASDSRNEPLHGGLKEARMGVFKSRNRIVTFRLSNEEYDRLQKACQDEEARSVSEFARSAVLRRVGTLPSGPQVPGHDIETLGEKLDELNGVLRGMKAVIRKVLDSRSQQTTRQTRGR